MAGYPGWAETQSSLLIVRHLAEGHWRSLGYLKPVQLLCSVREHEQLSQPGPKVSSLQWRSNIRGNVSMHSPNPESPQTFSGNHTDKKTIPKFASFKPKHAVSARINGEGQACTEDLERANAIRAASASGPKPQLYSLNSSPSYGNNDREDVEKRLHRNRPSSINTRHAPSDKGIRAYAIDKAGDSKNLTFGRLDQYAISSYLRFGAGGVLGSIIGQKLDRLASHEKSVELSYSKHGQKSERDRRAFWKEARTSKRELRVRPQAVESTAFGDQLDYVSLKGAREFERRRTNDDASLPPNLHMTELDTHYRSINTNVDSRNVLDDEDLAYASDASLTQDDVENGASAEDNAILNQRVELSRSVERNPERGDVWLELIGHQDKVSSMNAHQAGLTSAEQRSNAEIKLSMYDKALKNVREPGYREELLIGKLKQASRIWVIQRVDLEWQSVLRDNPSSFMLWTEYLNFTQTTLSKFRYDDVQECYKECLNRFKDVFAVPGASLASLEEVYVNQVYIILRMTLFMSGSGFVEQAVAAWQALLEFEFFRPSDLCDLDHKQGGFSHGNALSNFEAFWDSEVPRIGEEESQGWNGYEKTSGQHAQPKLLVAETPDDSTDHWGVWLQSEQRQGLLARNPARTIDELVKNDPYRVILSSDIKLFLIQTPSTGSRAVSINAFLAFCHLPPYCAEVPADKAWSWWKQGYMHRESQTKSNDTNQPYQGRACGIDMGAMDSESWQLESNLFESVTFDFRVSPDALFAMPWFSAFRMWCINYPRNSGLPEQSWILRTLRQLVSTGVGGDDLAEYTLALELYVSPTTVAKTARGLLRKRTSSLRLYNAYALIAYRLGNASNGEKALITSLRMCMTLDKAAQWGSILLWRTWVWELLCVGNTPNALAAMLMFGEKEVVAPPSTPFPEIQSLQPARLLRVEGALTSIRDDLLSIGQHNYAAAAIDCLVLFAYLKSSSSLSAATSTFQSNVQRLANYTPSSSPAQEMIHQSFARLLYHHVTHHQFVKPSDVRSFLTESIRLFPQNTIFLSLYAWNETRFRIDDRVRSIVKDLVLAESLDTKSKRRDSVISHFFAISCEMNRNVTFGSNVSTIRSTFERAVESPSGAHCVGLWKSYFLFEHSVGADRAMAISVFWRAVKACPWAKEMYLLAFEYLRGAGGLGDEELRGIYELMIEKELRIHNSLDNDKVD